MLTQFKNHLFKVPVQLLQLPFTHIYTHRHTQTYKHTKKSLVLVLFAVFAQVDDRLHLLSIICAP